MWSAAAARELAFAAFTSEIGSLANLSVAAGFQHVGGIMSQSKTLTRWRVLRGYRMLSLGVAGVAAVAGCANLSQLSQGGTVMEGLRFGGLVGQSSSEEFVEGSESEEYIVESPGMHYPLG